ncbi:MAG: prepilin peptidase [Clostridiales bacterium]|nr:prepilin peptidase [Clostridiales bacterium]
MLRYILIATVFILTIISAISDIKQSKVKNELFIVGATMGLTLNASMSGWTGLAISFFGLAVPILIFLPFASNKFRLFGLNGIKIIGMGDVKLFAFVGALVGITQVFSLIALTYAFGAIYSLIVMAKEHVLISRLSYFGTWIRSCAKVGGTQPYVSTRMIKFAPFMCLAVLVYYLYMYFE